MPMLVVAEATPRMPMAAPLPLPPRPMLSCGVMASKSMNPSSPKVSMRSSPTAVIATGISRTDSSVARAVTMISSISAANGAGATAARMKNGTSDLKM